MSEFKTNISEEIKEAIEAKYEFPSEIDLVDLGKASVFPPNIEVIYDGKVIDLGCKHVVANTKAIYKSEVFRYFNNFILLQGSYERNGDVATLVDPKRYLNLYLPI